MEKLKLTGLKYPKYPAAEIIKDIENFLTTQGIFFENETAYQKEINELGIIDAGNATPIEILIQIKES